jgi:hypothetical protein
MKEMAAYDNRKIDQKWTSVADLNRLESVPTGVQPGQRFMIFMIVSTVIPCCWSLTLGKEQTSPVKIMATDYPQISQITQIAPLKKGPGIFRDFTNGYRKQGRHLYYPGLTGRFHLKQSICSCRNGFLVQISP